MVSAHYVAGGVLAFVVRLHHSQNSLESTGTYTSPSRNCEPVTECKGARESESSFNLLAESRLVCGSHRLKACATRQGWSLVGMLLRTDFLIGRVVNHNTPGPYAFCKYIIIKGVKVLCFDRLLKEYQRKRLIDGQFGSDGQLRNPGDGSRKKKERQWNCRSSKFARLPTSYFN